MKPFGLVLVVLGLVGLLYGGLSWTRKDTIIDAGPIKVSADKRERLPISPIVGGVLLVSGVVLLLKRA